jgi:phosphoribosylanthranilate isomerase
MHQLHGSETPARVAEITKRSGKPAFKAFPVAVASDLAAVAAYESVADGFLFDAKAPKDATRPGGHGQPFDWTLLNNISRTKPVMLSGGLNLENIAQAIDIVRPDGVDVSSGVERAPGVKDRDKIFAFVRNARKHAMERVS